MNLSQLWKKEDWWTVWLGFIMIFGAVFGVLSRPELPKRWGIEGAETISASISMSTLPGILLTGIIIMVLCSVSIYFIKKEEFAGFLKAFPIIFILAILAYVAGNYNPWRHYGFNDVIWALALGLLISNTIKTPKFLEGAVRTELYIKTGLVLLGASILFNRMMALGMLGLGVAWVVTPVVVIFMFWFSQKVLKMQDNRGLAITIAASTSVCGVSAAIAAGTAAKARKEEISLAISVTLIFTVLMMLFMPAVVRVAGIDPIVGGAWLGGTIDSTGAVVAAGAMLGPDAMEVASVIKMIQNIMVGIIAFGVAVFFVAVYEKGEGKTAVGPMEIWIRMPKFIIGFIAASVIFSFFLADATVESSLSVVNAYRGFFFTLAFVSIGLETNFAEMARMVQGGKPLTLYLIGQTFNIILTLLAAWFFFSGTFFELPF
ncbi:putative integral membrane protein (TIGR00698 family) [Desulfitispora alkaliphila]|uniref:YeiH family protein n=1 Tax=Desulfitispora alkaliphila TaxID=622674 RepID=UPI003D208269